MKKIILSLLCLLVLVGFAVVFVFVHFTPKYKGDLFIDGLSAPVTVTYDQYGIPHIEAKNRKDLYLAYGYVVAQDRFFQIQLQKRIASGRLSEWFGTASIKTDEVLRTLGFHRWAKSFLKTQKNKHNPDFIADVEAWISGVNACFEQCPRPLEMVLLRQEPEKLDLEDIFAFAGSMSFSFTKVFAYDAILTDVASKLTPKMLADLTGAPSVKPIASLMRTPLRLPLMKDLDPMGLLPNMEGSQSWVIAPQKSVSGKAVLVNDPHIGFSLPGVWYEAHLKTNGFELYGHFCPILPFALLGHNADKAWALTMSDADDLDLIVPKELKSFATINEVIKVKGQDDIVYPVKVTEWGPVISSLLKSDKDFVMHWLFFQDDNYIIEGFHDLNHITKLEQFHGALAKGTSPGLNVSWADKDGHIAWKIFGRFPLYRAENWKAIELSEGQKPYLGYVPASENPGGQDPSQGYILSANQKPPVKFDEKRIRGYWDSNERYETLDKRIRSKTKLDLKDHEELLAVEELEGARQRLQSLLQEVTSEDTDVLDILRNWNGEASLKNKALGFYFEWIDAMAQSVLLAKFTEDQLKQFCDTHGYWLFMMRLLDDKTSEWWRGERRKILQKSFEDTSLHMRTTYGPPDKWEWGSMHPLILENPLGQVKPLDRIFNLGPFPVGGSFMTPNAQRHAFCRGQFNVSAGPSTRRIVDFAHPLKSYGILPSGNSGVIFSPYYRDQLEMYLKGNLRPQLMDWDEIHKEKKVLVLQSN